MKQGSLIIILIMICSVLVSANVPKSSYTPSLSIEKNSQTISIDGTITDNEWSKATSITNFIERNPGDNTLPSVNTETFITYDEDNLYVSFKCYDDPSTIRASMTQRDQYHGNDEVGVLIDTYGDASVAYMLYVNPLGVQKDFLWNPITGGDSGYDLIWESSAEITDFGYQVEMAIPFSSLRFPNKDVQSWKIDFRRSHPRESYHEYAWAAHDRNEQCGPCQWGTVDGISSVKPGKGIEILPTFVGNQNQRYNGNIDKLENLGSDGEVSLSGKYSITSDVTLEASLNPDFSQIEADAAQIDVNSTYSLFFPESRPFFQEGADIFRTMFNSFHSRTIANPQFVSKITGRPGSFRFGLVSAYDDSSGYIIPLEESDITLEASKSFVNSLRGLKSFGRNSRVGFMLNDRRYEGDEGSNTVFALDGDFSLTQSLRFDMQAIYAYTKEGTNDILGSEDIFYDGDYTLNFDNESYGGIATISRLRYATRTMYAQIGYNQLDPKYRTQTGFDPVNNHRSADFYAQYQFRPTSGLIERITPQASGFSRWHYRTGEKKLENYNVGLQTNLRVAQTFIGLNYGVNSEKYAGIDFDDLKNYSFDANLQLSSRVGFYFSYNFGDGIARGTYKLSDRKSIRSGLELKPIDNLNIEPSIRLVQGFDNADSDVELFKQVIARTRVSWQINRKLSLRVVGQFVDSKNTRYTNVIVGTDPFGEDISETQYAILKSKRFDIDPLVTYRLNPFTVFYLGMVNNYGSGDYSQNLIDKNIGYNNYDTRENQRKFFFKLQYLFQT